MKWCRRILAIVLIICMALGTVYIPGGTEKVCAAVSGDYEYEELSATTVKITKYSGSDVQLKIPDQIGGKTVTEIGAGAFKGNSSLTKIVVPNGVQYLGEEAFYNCTNLTDAGLPVSIVQLGSYVFGDCSSLKQVYYAGTQNQWSQIHTVYPENDILLNIDIYFNSDLILDKAEKDYEYEVLDDGTIRITKYIGKDTIVAIPEAIDGKQVTIIGEMAFFGRKDLTEVRIPNGVTAIMNAAFSGCTNLSKVNIPEKITSISAWTFDSCAGLTEIHIPEGVTSIGTAAFGSCTGLTKINIPDGVTNIESSAFHKCSSLMAVDLPDTVTSIEGDTFAYCHNLTQIRIPEHLEKIDFLAFKECSRLTEINLPDSLLIIEGSAFEMCSSLKKINIPEGITKINPGTFRGCSSLTEITIPKNVSVMESEAFKLCTSLKKVSIAGDVTSIKRATFSNCTSLEEISLPKSVTSVEGEAFDQCGNLKDVYYSGNENEWKEIEIAVEKNEALAKATIHFMDDDHLEKDFLYNILSNDTIELVKYTGSAETVKIPSQIDGKTVVSIGSAVFSYKENLREVTIPASVTKLSSDIFDHCDRLTNIFADPDHVTYVSEDGILFNREKTELVRYPEGRSGNYTVPSGIVKLGIGAFARCTQMPEVTLPDGLEEIGPVAFGECTAITHMELPETLKSIGSNAFISCTSLEQISIPGRIKELNSSLFLHCRKLKKAEIAEGVTQIGIYSFADCASLKAITIPVSVTSIASRAFYAVGIPCELEDVYYGGSQEQWEQIEVTGPILGEGDSVQQMLNLNAVIHFKENEPQPPQEETILPTTVDAKEELQRLKSGDPFSLKKDFQHYLSEEQIDIIESYLFTWLAEINFVYQYTGSDSVKERIMKKVGIDPHGDFTSGREQAITHICVDTKYGPRIFAVTLDLGKPDDKGNLYMTYGTMHYEILEKRSIPSDLPKSGQIGRDSYLELGTFVQCVRKASEDSLYSTYQWELLSDEMTSGVLVDKTVTEIIGNKNGSFSDAIFTVYAKPLLTYSKKVTIACPVDVHIYGMDGVEAGSIINNKPNGGNENVRLDVNGDTKTVYLTGNDYYLNLKGTDTGTMRYEVEEIANEEVRRNVQFLELQLKKDMQYEGYVFRPLNIDRELYALRTKDGSKEEVFYADSDTYQTLFKRVQGLSLSQDKTSLDQDKSIRLNASLVPLDASNPNLQWTTDRESVVKVDGNGLVTAVGTGRAMVTVSTKDGSFLKQYCVIDVAEKNNGSNDNGTGGSGNSSGSSGTGGSGNSSGGAGGSAQPVEQDKNPVVVNLHYVLQFDTNGGSNLSRKTMTLLADDSPGIMPKVQRKDYLFDGWYTKQDGGEKVAGDKPLKEAATLYAKWSRVTAPAKSAVSALKSKKKGQVQVSFQNINGVSGYQIEYALNNKFTAAKTKEAGKAAKTKTISGLKAGKKYYVRVRAYQLDSMKNRIYGAYGTAKSVKVKS